MSAGRTTKVAVGITAASTAVGAVAGLATAAVLATIIEGPGGLADLGLFTFAGGVGAACGAILGPAAAFGFMRRVPIGRLFAETALGTIIGGVGGLLLLPIGIFGVVTAGAVGFGAAAARLAWSFRKPREQHALPPGA